MEQLCLVFPHIKCTILDFHGFLQEFFLVCIYTHTCTLVCANRNCQTSFSKLFSVLSYLSVFQQMGIVQEGSLF